MPEWSQAELEKELWGYLLIFLLIGAIWLLIYIPYQKDLDILATSKEIEVFVTGKRIGGGKGRPRLVYIRDGGVPIAVKTTGRWYFETVIGKKTMVRYSEKYHEYRQPYHRTNGENFMCWYIGLFLIGISGRVIWAIQRIWLGKNKPGSVDANPG